MRPDELPFVVRRSRSISKESSSSRHTPYGLRGEGLNLELPNFNLKFKKNSFTYSLTKLWNSLPSQVRLSSDANDFRSKLHDCSFLERLSYSARL